MDISAMKETDYLEGNTKLIADLQKIDVFEPFTEEELQKLLSIPGLFRNSGEAIEGSHEEAAGAQGKRRYHSPEMKGP
jgi:hypothetical protein